MLLAKATDWDGSAWRVEGLDEPRLNLLNSGLYAFLLSPGGELLWHSPSSEQIGNLADPLGTVQAGARDLGLLAAGIGETRYAMCALEGQHLCQSTRIGWGSAGPESIFLVVEGLARIEAAR